MLGNHDYWGDDRAARRNVRRRFPMLAAGCYTLRHRGLGLVFLNSNLEGSPGREQTAWFERRLLEFELDESARVCAMRVAVLEKNGEEGWFLLDGDRARRFDGSPFEGARLGSIEVAWSAADLRAPVKPSKIVCVGRNYAAHAKELGNEVRALLREDLDDVRLVSQRRSVRLEPEIAVGRGRTHGGRPRAHVRLLDRACPAGTERADRLVDPDVCLGEPVVIRPVDHGQNVVRRRRAVSRRSAPHEGSVNGVKLP